MKKRTRKILIWITSIIGVGILGYLGFIVYVIYSFTSGCGMDDGPFKAVKIDEIVISDSAMTFNLAGNGKLILENRNKKFSPILIFVEKGKVKWTLDINVSNTEGYENCRIWKISNLTVVNNADPIKLSFIAYWTYGAEKGSMEIDRDDGKNTFCLSW